MATTAQWGNLHWGDVQWGSIDEGDTGLVGSATIALSGAGSLTTGLSLAGAATIQISSVGVLTTAIALVGAALIEIMTAASKLTSKGVARIRDDCGHPTMALKDWKDPNSC